MYRRSVGEKHVDSKFCDTKSRFKLTKNSESQRGSAFFLKYHNQIRNKMKHFFINFYRCLYWILTVSFAQALYPLQIIFIQTSQIVRKKDCIKINVTNCSYDISCYIRLFYPRYFCENLHTTYTIPSSSPHMNLIIPYINKMSNHTLPHQNSVIQQPGIPLSHFLQ